MFAEEAGKIAVTQGWFGRLPERVSTPGPCRTPGTEPRRRGQEDRRGLSRAGAPSQRGLRERGKAGETGGSQLCLESPFPVTIATHVLE